MLKKLVLCKNRNQHTHTHTHTHQINGPVLPTQCSIEGNGDTNEEKSLSLNSEANRRVCQRYELHGDRQVLRHQPASTAAVRSPERVISVDGSTKDMSAVGGLDVRLTLVAS
jgi:hypothetical protein